MVSWGILYFAPVSARHGHTSLSDHFFFSIIIVCSRLICLFPVPATESTNSVFWKKDLGNKIWRLVYYLRLEELSIDRKKVIFSLLLGYWYTTYYLCVLCFSECKVFQAFGNVAWYVRRWTISCFLLWQIIKRNGEAFTFTMRLSMIGHIFFFLSLLFLCFFHCLVITSSLSHPSFPCSSFILNLFPSVFSSSLFRSHHLVLKNEELNKLTENYFCLDLSKKQGHRQSLVPQIGETGEYRELQLPAAETSFGTIARRP